MIEQDPIVAQRTWTSVWVKSCTNPFSCKKSTPKITGATKLFTTTNVCSNSISPIRMELLMWPNSGSSAPDAVMSFRCLAQLLTHSKSLIPDICSHTSYTEEPESSITSALTPPNSPHTVAAFDLVIATVTTVRWRLTVETGGACCLWQAPLGRFPADTHWPSDLACCIWSNGDLLRLGGGRDTRWTCPHGLLLHVPNEILNNTITKWPLINTIPRQIYCAIVDIVILCILIVVFGTCSTNKSKRLRPPSVSGVRSEYVERAVTCSVSFSTRHATVHSSTLPMRSIESHKPSSEALSGSMHYSSIIITRSANVKVLLSYAVNGMTL